MPSPFPGMDPYLEDPRRWRDVHHGLISELQAALNQQLRPRFVARVEERVYTSDENDPGRGVIIPDVFVMESAYRGAGRSRGGVATASAVDEVMPIEVTTFIEEEIHEAYIEILDTESRAIITMIEVLSPTNKVAGSRGRASYLAKREQAMRSTAHLIEIDLLRAGERLFVKEWLPPFDYLIHLSRHQPNGMRRATVWPIPMQFRLPTIPIPLRPGDSDISIDLKQILSPAYDRGGYDMEIDYRQSPTPPFTPEQDDWAHNLVERHAM